jgi:hypothetical protein
MQTNKMCSLTDMFGAEKRWVNWRYVMKDGKETKVPYQVNGRRADSTDPSTWSTYDEVARVSDKVSIVFASDERLLGIDIDHVIEDGVVRDDIQRFVDVADTYTEISPSGTGLHLYLAVTERLALVKHKKAPYEFYTSKRFFTVTGNEFAAPAKPIRTVTPEEALKLLALTGYPWNKDEPEAPVAVPSSTVKPPTLPSMADEVLLEKIFTSKNGAKVKKLYDGNISEYADDESRADMALCSHLAFWTGKDATQMERIWLASGLGNREKTQSRADYRQRTIDVAIEHCTETYAEKGRRKDSRAKNLLDAILNRSDVILFHDEFDEGYISLIIDGHREVLSCKSKSLKKWLSKETYRMENNALGSDALKSVLAVLEGNACYGGPEHRLNNRMALLEGELWYDLTNKAWQAIRLNEDGWEIAHEVPTIFRRYSHHKPQVMPVKEGGDVRRILGYVNVTDEKQKLLLLVYLVSCFIPDFPHVLLIIFGSQGSAKSTLSRLLRCIVDPSAIEVASMPDNQKELIQTLAHHAFLFFDNVSFISEATSDTLCKAVTGGGFPKRELYSDDDDVIYNFMRCVGINGINLVATRPDLLERSLLIELQRIDPSDRKQEKEIMNNFQKDLPIILGGVFDVLVKAMRTYPTVNVESLPRMADFATWGCAIAEALGSTQEEFMEAYQANIAKQAETVLNENIVAAVMISFMGSRDEWTGTASQLLYDLTNHAAFDERIDTYEKGWPKASNSLMRRLNELKVTLKDVGILFTSTPGNTREITLKKVLGVAGTDGTDDVSRE